MEFMGIFFSLLFAAILTAIFSLGFKNTGPWEGYWMFFILLFLVALGAGEWAIQKGPSAWGYYWVPGLLSAIIIALVLAAASPSTGSSKQERKRNRIRDGMQQDAPVAEELVVVTAIAGIFFWILVFVLVIIALAGLFYQN